MNIKDSKTHCFGGFELDINKISNTSTSDLEIRLTYTGELPEPYDAASIFMRVTPECVAVVLKVENGKRKPIKYILEASREEINAILWPLFWFKAAETEYRTRFDNGLSESSAHRLDMMRPEIIHDHDIARAESGDQNIL